jgi:DNA primase
MADALAHRRHKPALMTRLVDFARVKAEASFEQILERYGVRIGGRGKKRMALCPFHPDTKPSCSIHLGRNVFYCFGCGAKGSVLDFVARIENVSIADAAARVQEICGLRSEPLASQTYGARADTRESNHGRAPASPLPPLPFRLKLDPAHPYLSGRGVSPELAVQWGLGYCACGTIMQGSICIPIHDERGALVAYAGRRASDDIPRGVPKYLLPRGFEKRRVLFGLCRVKGSEHLILVEGYWSVFRLHTLGLPAVALMGRVLSTEQETLLKEFGARMLTLLLDGDRPGREATERLLPRLATDFFVRVVHLPNGVQPDTVPEQFLLEFLAAAAHS